MEKSVNISRNERSLIRSAARAAFAKTATSKDHNPNFLKDLTKKIINKGYELLDETIPADEAIVSRLAFGRIDRISGNISNYQLENELTINRAYAADDDTNSFDHSGSLIIKSQYLLNINMDEVLIPERFKKGDYAVEPLTQYGNTIIDLDDSVLEEIEKHNAIIEENLGDLDNSLKALLTVIDECKTTKAFNTKLAAFKNLYPLSLRRKIVDKNEVAEEETEEQAILNKANAVIATAALIGD